MGKEVKKCPWISGRALSSLPALPGPSPASKAPLSFSHNILPWSRKGSQPQSPAPAHPQSLPVPGWRSSCPAPGSNPSPSPSPEVTRGSQVCCNPLLAAREQNRSIPVFKWELSSSQEARLQTEPLRVTLVLVPPALLRFSYDFCDTCTGPEGRGEPGMRLQP